MASGAWDSAVRVWDAVTGGLVSTLTGHADTVSALAFLAGGGQIVSGGVDKSVRLWDVVYPSITL